MDTSRIEGFVNRYLPWLDPNYRKYGNPDVVVHKSGFIGNVVEKEDDSLDLDIDDPFFRETPYLWQGKKVLDLGCGGKATLDKLLEHYPSIDYTGLDIKEGEGVDIVADAREELPFADKEFDTICAFGFLTEDINHWARCLKDDGYFAASCTQSSWNKKEDWYTSIKKAFKIIEERRYSFKFKERYANHSVIMKEVKVIGVHK